MARATRLVLALLPALLVGMAPVPKERDKEDPLKFPRLDAPQWQKRESGLKVWDVKPGDGAEVRPGATVTVHYIGWLTDGKVFDTSRKDLATRPAGGEPLTIGLGQLIQGWQEGMAGMKVGGVRRLLIPPELGYGARGAPPTVPENATLVFAVEVIRAESK
jgi:FKBP-type peptidyl-prolyl cis-trans isomerase FkpA